MSFLDILRAPNEILVQTDSSAIRFEEQPRVCPPAPVDYIVENNCARVVLKPSIDPVKRVKLRWNGDMACVLMVMGDRWERVNADMYWLPLSPKNPCLGTFTPMTDKGPIVTA